MEGEFNNGTLKKGTGSFTYNDGKYVGGVEEGLPVGEGKWTKTSKDGFETILEGTFDRGTLASGTGTFQYEGGVYVGAVYYGYPGGGAGRWTRTVDDVEWYNDGTFYMGYLQTGTGLRGFNGGYYTGAIVDDLITGEGEWKGANGDTQTGTWDNGVFKSGKM